MSLSPGYCLGSPEGDKTWRLQDFPMRRPLLLESHHISTSFLIALHLAPEPSSLAGKDKCKPHLPVRMDHITHKEWVPGTEDGFGDSGGVGVVYLPGVMGSALELVAFTF